jgi:hypothetical protein
MIPTNTRRYTHFRMPSLTGSGAPSDVSSVSRISSAEIADNKPRCARASSEPCSHAQQICSTGKFPHCDVYPRTKSGVKILVSTFGASSHRRDIVHKSENLKSTQQHTPLSRHAIVNSPPISRRERSRRPKLPRRIRRSELAASLRSFHFLNPELLVEFFVRLTVNLDVRVGEVIRRCTILL